MRIPNLRQFGQFLLVVVVAGVLTEMTSGYVSEEFPVVRSVAVKVAVAVLTLFALFLVFRWAIGYVVNGRWAVEAFILTSDNGLVMYKHPHHKRMLPPGGRVGRSELPHLAIQSRLKERLDLDPSQYEFHPRIHHGLEANSGDLGDTERCPAPFLVQRELHRQRRLIKSHYDFIYVLRLVDGKYTFGGSSYAPVHIVHLDDLLTMAAAQRTFPDVLDAYRRILKIVAP